MSARESAVRRTIGTTNASSAHRKIGRQCGLKSTRRRACSLTQAAGLTPAVLRYAICMSYRTGRQSRPMAMGCEMRGCAKRGAMKTPPLDRRDRIESGCRPLSWVLQPRRGSRPRPRALGHSTWQRSHRVRMRAALPVRRTGRSRRARNPEPQWVQDLASSACLDPRFRCGGPG